MAKRKQSPQGKSVAADGLISDNPSATKTSQAAPDAKPGEKSDLENWADRPDSGAYSQAKRLYNLILAGYQNKDEFDRRSEEFWAIYNAQPDDNQQYTGNSQGYIPAVRDALQARTKRTLKLLFPANYKHVDGISSDDEVPFTLLSLLEYYIRTTNLKSTVRSDLVAGDVSGQWCLMIDWAKSVRAITKVVKKNQELVATNEDGTTTDLELPGLPTDEDVTKDDEIATEGPEIVDFTAEDLVVIPPTCTDLQKAEAVAVRLRLSAERVRTLVDEGVLILPKSSDINGFCYPEEASGSGRTDRRKKQSSDAGVKTRGTDKYAEVWMVYSKLDFGGSIDQSGISYFSGPGELCGIIKNPLWSGKVPIVSAPVERIQGSFFGVSKIEPVKYVQWQLNDFWNMGQDSAMYSLLPIFAADPLKNPNWATMTMGLAAVWPIAPDGITTIEMPQLWKDATALCDTMKRQIWESLDVNEMMMGAMPAGRKNNAMMGGMQQEQSTNITDHAQRYEEVMLNPLLELMFEFDQQYRTADLMIETRGPIGQKAKMEVVKPVQFDARYHWRWTGSEYVQNMQLMQQKIAFMNVLKGIPPQQLGGLTLDVTPILLQATEDMFGPDIAPKILVDKRHMYTVAANIEDEMMHNGFAVDTHDADDDQAHLQSHMRAASLNKDPIGLYKQHMGQHMMQIQKKRETEQANQPQQGGMPGGPGGAQPGVGGQAPGVAGAPRPGAMPGEQRPMQQPPGAIQQDDMAGAPGRG